MKPRQEEAFNSVIASLNSGIDKQLVNLPTGVGKTVLAAYTAGQFERTLFTVPTIELLDQAINTFRRAYPGSPVAKIHGRSTDHHARFVVGTIGTLYNRLDRIPADAFDLVIVDEAHHATAKTWATTLNHFQPTLRLGLSATPERSDGAPLSNLFDDITYQMTIKDAVEDGYLAPPIGIQVSTEEDLDTVRTTAGDLNQGDLAATINTPSRNNLIVNAWEEHAGPNAPGAGPRGRRTVIFTVSIEHAQHLAEAFTDRGITATWVSGADPERHTKLRDYSMGRYQVICNAAVLTEGWDDPATDCVIMARPTKSKTLYVQAAGRGLRLHPGKQDCLIIDVADNTKRHRLMTVWDFWGTKKPRGQTSGPVALRTATRQALEDVSDIFADLFDQDLELEAFHSMVDLLSPPPDVRPPKARSWHQAPPTAAQVKQLRLLGHDLTDSDWTRGQASALIDNAPAHPNALRTLLAYGFDVLSTSWTVAQANAALAQAQKQGRRQDRTLIHQLSTAHATGGR